MEPPLAHRKTSTLGIASLVIAIGFPSLLIALLVISMVVEETVHYNAAKKLDLIIGCLAIIGGPIVHLTGLVFGIVGAIQKDLRKLVPLLAIGVNAVLFVTAVVITVFFMGLILAGFGAFH